jgi:hypothetical protein
MKKRAWGLWGVVTLGAAWGCASTAAPGASASVAGTGGSLGTGAGGAGGNPSTADGDVCPSTCPEAASSTCLELVDNSGASQFTLRMADLLIKAPPSLKKGLVQGVLRNGVTMNFPSCYLDGGGTFSWLLRFDTVSGKLTTGGARPVDDPTKGYSFVDETLVQGGKSFKIAPFSASAPIQGGAFAITAGHDLILPVYLDILATKAVLLPLRDVKLTGTLSPHNNCVGKLNPKFLEQSMSCWPDTMSPAFLGADGTIDSDGAIDAYLLLEDADAVDVEAVGQSLCVILSGDAGTYGDGASPIARCKRDAGMKILFQGDWCGASNDASCTDAVRFAAGFSASAVKGN